MQGQGLGTLLPYNRFINIEYISLGINFLRKYTYTCD